MTLKLLKNTELHESMKFLFAQENKLNQSILNHIMEVDRRKLFLEMAFPSLFEYLTVGIGFSAGSAQRRIDAARLMRQIPELEDKIKSGAINLSQISKVQFASRALKKATGKAVSRDTKKLILDQIQNKSAYETDLLISKELDLPIQQNEKKRVQKDESVRIELTFSKDEMAQINSAQELLSHSVPSSQIKDLILYLTKKVIKQKTKVFEEKISNQQLALLRKTENKDSLKSNLTKTSVLKKFNQKSNHGERSQMKFIPREKSMLKTVHLKHTLEKNHEHQALTKKMRNFVLRRDSSCQYQDPTSGKLCGSRYFLEVDHIKPKWAGGLNNLANLRALCGSHNQYRYQRGR